MKAKLLSILLLGAIIFTMNSCSTGDSVPADSSLETVSFTYNDTEKEAMNLINNYRISVGLKALEPINYASLKSEQHDNYMISNNVVNHNDFVARSEDIMKITGAKTVSENIAYNYNSPQAALDAWLKSPSHKENIEGNFTNFGIAIRVNEAGKKYYTNIFLKI